MSDNSMPSIDRILENTKTHPDVKYQQNYGSTFLTPGGYRDLFHLLGLRRALTLFGEETDLKSFTKLRELNAALCKFEKRLVTHNKDWPTSGFRSDDEVYLYPKCPRGVPLDKFHHLVFENNKEACEKYDGLLKTYANDWYNIIQSGQVTASEEKALFRRVSRASHGENKDFLLAWLKFNKTHFKTNEKGLEEREYHPFLYAVGLHNLIIRHMPFVQGNRRVARFLLSQALAISGIYPPLFWSAAGYEALIPKITYAHIKMIESEQSEYTLELLLKKDQDEKQFMLYICALSAEAAALSTKEGRNDERPYEEFEHWLTQNDLKRGIMAYLITRRRVLLSELIVAVSLFYKISGTELIPYDDKKFIWSGVDKELAKAINELKKDGKIEYAPAFKEEYESVVNVPDRKMLDEWQPVALRATPIKA